VMKWRGVLNGAARTPRRTGGSNSAARTPRRTWGSNSAAGFTGDRGRSPLRGEKFRGRGVRMFVIFL
jgi:hypothetical protein